VWTAVALGLIIVWALLVCWYVVIFGLFGIFTFPYRLIRRSQRKSQHVQRAQLATMQAMMAGQMNDPGNTVQTRDGEER
jgi:cyanate permease